MKKDDYLFNKDDLEEIFGEKIILNEKEIEKKAMDEIKEISKSIVINKSKYVELENYHGSDKITNKDNKKVTENSVLKEKESFPENSIKEREEILTFPDFLDESIIKNIFEFNEELRKIIEKELIEILPERTVFNMLLRTLEKTAVNYLILRNTNFSKSGEIRKNGSIDTERLAENIEKYKTQIMELDKEIEGALKTLFNMRMGAIKSGLGQKYYESIKANILKKINMIKAGYKQAIFNFFKNNILTGI